VRKHGASALRVVELVQGAVDDSVRRARAKGVVEAAVAGLMRNATTAGEVLSPDTLRMFSDYTARAIMGTLRAHTQESICKRE